MTPVGGAKLADASRAIAAIERRMLSDLSAADQDTLRASLGTCVDALTASDIGD